MPGDGFRQGTGRKPECSPKSSYHFPIGSRKRIHSLVETCTFEEMDAKMTSVDMLNFKGVDTYASKLESHQKKTALKEAVVTGICKIGDQRAALGVMDFSFLGGSMGSVVGEKLTRFIERATEKELPVIIISSSGGARMYEGMFSLMQMAKTCRRARLPRATTPALHQRAHASDHGGRDGQLRELGDLILAEPGAMVGFAGRASSRTPPRPNCRRDFRPPNFSSIAASLTPSSRALK